MLENKSVRGENSLRSLAMEICKKENRKSSWIQTSNKSDLIDWILMENIKVFKDGKKTPTPSGNITTETVETGSDSSNEQESGSDSNNEQESGSETKENTEIVKLPLSDHNKFVTNNGLLYIHETNKVLGVNLVADALNSLNSATVSTFKTLNKEIARLKSAVKNGSSSNGVTELNISINGANPVKIAEHTHPKFKDILLDLTLDRQALLIGASGTGKTFMGKQLGKALNVQFKHISCSEGMAEAHLLGRMLFNGDYVKADFVDCYENGGLFLMDEMDACDSNTLVVLNSALANGIMSVPNRRDNPTAKRHKDFYFLGAMNTFGTDNGSFQYVGRNQLDQATLDRFVLSRHIVNYDKKLEKSFCLATYEINGSKVNLSNNSGMDIYNIISTLRERVTSEKMLKVLSTRLFEKLCPKYVALGGGKQAMLKCLEQYFIGWEKQSINRLDHKVLIENSNLKSWSK